MKKYIKPEITICSICIGGGILNGSNSIGFDPTVEDYEEVEYEFEL